MAALYRSVVFFVFLAALAAVAVSEAEELASPPHPPIVSGLSFGFYKSRCPRMKSIVRSYLKRAFERNIGLAAALLRVHFHDCFVQGCDGSVLLDGSTSGPGEQSSIPNLTLRPAAFAAINEIRDLLHESCGRVVSCSDIAALAARDSVYMSGGPRYRVPLGRRDGLTFATNQATLDSLPSPFSNTTVLIDKLANIGLDATDLVALSGGHTIGIGHCGSFSNRLYPSQDPGMDKTFAKNLYRTCPTSSSNGSTVLDIRSPDVFDNKYYVNLMNRQGLFTTDQDLYTDPRTRGIVTSFAVDQQLFFERFAYSMVKMGQLGVLTGDQGEIRANCSARNPGSAVDGPLHTVVDGDGESAAV